MPSAGRMLRDRRGAIVLIGIGAAFLALLVGLASIGNPAPVGVTAAAVIDTLVRAGLPGLLYVGAAIGLGRLFAPLTRGSADPLALQAGLGLALMLSLSHALGWSGLLLGGWGLFIRMVPLLVGLSLVADQARRAWRSPGRARAAVSPVALLALPGLALIIVAACQPPGWLWSSEFGGYDALSYHLQLPQEWLRLGWIRPLEHNVYSYQPGYVESAFLHVGVLMIPGYRPPPSGGTPAAWWLIEGDGMPLMACQLLHVWLAVVSAWLLARCVRAAIRAGSPTATDGGWGPPSGLDPSRTTSAPAFAGVMFLVTPWIVVVGSLAYNEMGVTALGAPALLCAMETGLSPVRRGVACGLLVGVACGCKATALLFVGLPVGVMLLGLSPVHTWPRIVLAGSIAGLAALMPWLIRNALLGGNPVFPFLTSVFGYAHWSPEQAERFRAATIFDGSLADRLSLLVFRDAHDPAGPRHRGLLHPQWALFFPLGVGATAVVIWFRSTRRIGVLLAVGLVLQLLAWLFASHLQSRFLIPLAIPACVALGLGASYARRLPARADLVIMILAAAVQFGMALLVFTGEKRGPDGRGRPNALLVPGPGVFTGAIYAGLAEAEGAAPTPEIVLNHSPTTTGGVYLLGDGTPLYFAVPLLYATTWDRSVLAEAMREYPGDPARWTESLRGFGVGRVLVNFGELDRLRRSGFLDPALTPEAVKAWLDTSAVPLREWAGGRRVLYGLAGEGLP